MVRKLRKVRPIRPIQPIRPIGSRSTSGRKSADADLFEAARKAAAARRPDFSTPRS